MVQAHGKIKALCMVQVHGMVQVCGMDQVCDMGQVHGKNWFHGDHEVLKRIPHQKHSEHYS